MDEWRKKIEIAGRSVYSDWKWHEMIKKMLKENYKYGDHGLDTDTIPACDFFD